MLHCHPSLLASKDICIYLVLVWSQEGHEILGMGCLHGGGVSVASSPAVQQLSPRLTPAKGREGRLHLCA